MKQSSVRLSQRRAAGLLLTVMLTRPAGHEAKAEAEARKSEAENEAEAQNFSSRPRPRPATLLSVYEHED